MNLKYAILADAAQASPDGKFHLLGGGISITWSPQLPAPIHVSLITGFEHSIVEAGQHRRLIVRLTDADGHDALPAIEGIISLAAREPHIPSGAPLMSHSVINIIAPLPEYGTYSFEILLDDNNVGSVPLVVAAPPVQMAEAS